MVYVLQFQWVTKASIGMPAMPQVVLNHYHHNLRACYFDIMPEIGRVWATIDNTLYIWRIGDKCETPFVRVATAFDRPVLPTRIQVCTLARVRPLLLRSAVVLLAVLYLGLPLVAPPSSLLTVLRPIVLRAGLILDRNFILVDTAWLDMEAMAA